MAKVHHLNCATMCPYSARLLAGEGGWREPAKLICHVLAIESNDGIVLVDTGLGTADCSNPARTGGLFRVSTRPRFAVEETAIERLRGLGFAPADVRHIVLTHLDVDHAGGLGDFPDAQVHVFRTEMQAALNPGVREKLRYVSEQWAHGPAWVPYETAGDSWFGFESVRAIEGLDVEVAIVPIAGHTRGHSAVAVRSGDGWLLHCGDGYFHRAEMEQPPEPPPGIKLFQSVVDLDRKQRLANQDRLRRLNSEHGSEIEIFCAHDPLELERLQAPAGS
ncbi:MAG TPA: MBL fold metallo-hydrolase [Solirubrobacterales bacterium]|nr:MBL fold metallo-hydrolase [Solirubrobacterales bacterium]